MSRPSDQLFSALTLLETKFNSSHLKAEMPPFGRWQYCQWDSSPRGSKNLITNEVRPLKPKCRLGGLPTPQALPPWRADQKDWIMGIDDG